jgi:hypothetical protein
LLPRLTAFDPVSPVANRVIPPTIAFSEEFDFHEDRSNRTAH